MDYSSQYAEFLKKYANIKRPLKIVCDASNGTTSIVLEKLTGIPNAQFVFINTNLDPEFPAHGPNPIIPGATEMLSKKILEIGADFGVAFDSDGDRAFFVDNEGKLLYSFITAAIWFNASKPPFVADELIYLSLTTSNIAKSENIIPSRVGAIFVKEAMQKSAAVLGAEFSGHFYFKDFFGLDSGILSMIHMANVLSMQDKTLAQLHVELSKQALSNVNMTLQKATWEKVREAAQKETSSIAKNIYEREGLTIITETGWINIRPSNTEPLVRISVGGTTNEAVQENMAIITSIVRKTDGGAI